MYLDVDVEAVFVPEHGLRGGHVYETLHVLPINAYACDFVSRVWETGERTHP